MSSLQEEFLRTVIRRDSIKGSNKNGDVTATDKRSSLLPLACRKRARRTRVRSILMHPAALFMIHFHSKSRLLSILGCSINFRIDGVRELATAAAVTRHREIYGPRIFANFASGYGHRNRGKIGIPGALCRTDGIFKRVWLTSYLHWGRDMYANTQRRDTYSPRNNGD